MNKEEQEVLLRKIAEEVYKSGWIDEQVRRLSVDKMLMDDLVQDMLISIMEYPNDALVECYNKGEHLYFIKKMITNQYCSKNSKFYYAYRKDVGLDVDDYTIDTDNNVTKNINNEEIY